MWDQQKHKDEKQKFTKSEQKLSTKKKKKEWIKE